MVLGWLLDVTGADLLQMRVMDRGLLGQVPIRPTKTRSGRTLM